MLEAINLSKSFNSSTALHPLNLRIESGEIFCLLGANGAGKTTTINLFLNFIPPTSGAADVDGLDVTQTTLESKRYFAYIPEQVMLYRNLTGLENLEYFTALAGCEKFSKNRLRRFLIDAGLQADAADKRVGSYSKGMRQKVGIAIATAKNAKALLLDEPTSGLDPKTSNEFFELLKRLRGERSRNPDGHARPVPGQRDGDLGGHHVARPNGGANPYQGSRARRLGATLPGAHARLIGRRMASQASDHDWIPTFSYGEEAVGRLIQRMLAELLAVLAPAILLGIRARRRLPPITGGNVGKRGLRS